MTSFGSPLGSSPTPEEVAAAAARIKALIDACRADAESVRYFRESVAASTGSKLEISTSQERVVEHLAELIDILFGPPTKEIV
jgi:hypothetical protein